jgi:type I restriction enzyme S subunit
MTEELRRKAEAQMTGSVGQRRVPAEFFDNFKIPLFPRPEQFKIVEILDTHDARIRTEEQYSGKLKLQKKGLMHDLLTGKVRVKI